ncbi:extended synaptotagmin-3 isoform X2 [Esox lucius]|uniref:extended synaptotagmin-3 isoform X2 n=1 Tax=Esox lucius TaxID=8010 RepID=UPI001476D9C4|nr:extended synaptotagmin-3 isoform X2 [Esox lucius]
MNPGDSKGPVQGGFGEDSISGSKQTLSPKAVNQLLLEFLMYCGRALLVFYPVYLTGYLGLSISWILLCTAIITWWTKNSKRKDIRIGTALNFLDNETHLIQKQLKSLNMASWVHFPEVEKVDWLNKILMQAWPFFGAYMEKLLKEKIQQSIRLSSPYLKTFTFKNVSFGQKPLKITGVQVYTHEVDRREVVFDLHISYDGDVDIDSEVKPAINAGLKSIKLQGMLRVILEPLIAQAPLVGGITMFFIRRPTLQINWTGMTNLLDAPALSHLSETAIIDNIASFMVLPNRMCIPFIDQVKVDQMRFPLPRGVVRVHLLEARDLMAMDIYMLGMGKGSSDPYAVLRVGTISFKSKTVKKNLHPRWDEIREFVVHEAPGQELEIEVYDEDTDKDDFLGKYRLDFGEVKKHKEIDKWFRLEDATSGEIHLKLQWLSLHTDPGRVMTTTGDSSCAMLAVYLDNASNLPKDQTEFNHKRDGKQTKEHRVKRKATNPNSYARLSIDQQCLKSKVVYASKDPVWEQCFTFFVQNIENQQLNVQIKEHEKKTLLGTLNVPLSRLLNASDMTLDQLFHLELSGANSQIKMKATLRMLALEKPEPKAVSDSTPKVQAQPLQKPPAPNLVPSSTLTSAPSSSVAPPSSDPSSSSISTPSSSLSHPSTTLTAAVPATSTNGFHEDDMTRSQGTLLAANGRRTAPSTPAHMRRYDSQSLLSENSIASSRFDLSDKAPYPDYIMSHVGTFGEINMTLRYTALRNRLIVMVHSCRDLFACSKDGSDAYVRLYLLPDQSWKHRMRTQVKKKTVTPAFNEKFEFNVSLADAGTRKLDVAVKNNRMFHTRERNEIGMVLIDLSQIDLAKGVTEWFELTLPGMKKTV